MVKDRPIGIELVILTIHGDMQSVIVIVVLIPQGVITKVMSLAVFKAHCLGLKEEVWNLKVHFNIIYVLLVVIIYIISSLLLLVMLLLLLLFLLL